VGATGEFVTQLKEAALSTGLVISENKPSYMKINRNVTNLEQNLITDGQVYEGFQNFRKSYRVKFLKICTK
jgi:hypothetical protein